MGSECDHSSDLVSVYSDSIAETAPYVERGVLVEYSDDGISVYMTGVEDDCAAQLLDRVLDHLQGS